MMSGTTLAWLGRPSRDCKLFFFIIRAFLEDAAHSKVLYRTQPPLWAPPAGRMQDATMCIKPHFLPPSFSPEQMAVVRIPKRPKLRLQHQATLGRHLHQRLHPLPGQDEGQGLCALAHQHQAVQVKRGEGKGTTLGNNLPPRHDPSR